MRGRQPSQPQSSPPSQSPQPNTTKEGKKASRTADKKYEPPPAGEMRNRLCALNYELINEMKRRFPDREIPAAEVTKWFKDNPSQLNGTGIPVSSVSTDHILSKSNGGHNHVFNYCLMPKGHNSHFNQYCTAEKKAYVGKQGFSIAQGFAEWCRAKAAPDLPYFNFRPENYF